MRLERKIVFLSPPPISMCVCVYMFCLFIYTSSYISTTVCVCVCTDRRRGVKCCARYIIIPSVQRFLYLDWRKGPPSFFQTICPFVYYIDEGQIIEIFFLLLLYLRPEEKFGD